MDATTVLPIAPTTVLPTVRVPTTTISTPTIVNCADRQKIGVFIAIDKEIITSGRVQRKISVESLDRFAELCFGAITREEIFELVDLYEQLCREYIISVKHVYNSTIGWALPSRAACGHLYNAWREHVARYPDARFIDVGAGTGIFSYVMALMGIPASRITALDRAEPTHALHGQRTFWQTVEGSGDIRSRDMLFVAWGYGTAEIIDDYIWTGGSCVVILGELEYGCTFPADHFYRIGRCECESCREAWSDDSWEEVKYSHKRRVVPHDVLGWTIELYHVPGPASQYAEHISINVRRL